MFCIQWKQQIKRRARDTHLSCGLDKCIYETKKIRTHTHSGSNLNEIKSNWIIFFGRKSTESFDYGSIHRLLHSVSIAQKATILNPKWEKSFSNRWTIRLKSVSNCGCEVRKAQKVKREWDEELWQRRKRRNMSSLNGLLIEKWLEHWLMYDD